LAAHADLEPHGISFLSVREGAGSRPIPPLRPSIKHREETPSRPVLPQRFDVALSFAGTERLHAEELAKQVRGAGFEVFYDGFYPEQLWGKDLASFFDRIYRKDSRFCVMFVSHEYAERMWTTHERRSAQARAVQEKGREYILPVRVDDTDLDGLPLSANMSETLTRLEFSVG
ncbi:MAG: TIR domain-containing protein, partial [Dehalococcoidia bacterium]|nr:TIR domain-containing protein [Dehalococcoidia bacterium]